MAFPHQVQEQDQNQIQTTETLSSAKEMGLTQSALAIFAGQQNIHYKTKQKKAFKINLKTEHKTRKLK